MLAIVVAVSIGWADMRVRADYFAHMSTHTYINSIMLYVKQLKAEWNYGKTYENNYWQHRQHRGNSTHEIIIPYGGVVESQNMHTQESTHSVSAVLSFSSSPLLLLRLLSHWALRKRMVTQFNARKQYWRVIHFWNFEFQKKNDSKYNPKYKHAHIYTHITLFWKRV